MKFLRNNNGLDESQAGLEHEERCLEMKRSNKTLMAFGSVFLVVLLVLSCDNPSDSTQGDAIIWPEGSSPQIESANGEFTLKRGSPGGRVVKIDYYYALRTVLAPSRGSDTETDWSDWTRLLDAGTYKALVGEYHLFAIAGDSAGNTVRSEEVIFEVHSLPKWVAPARRRTLSRYWRIGLGRSRRGSGLTDSGHNPLLCGIRDSVAGSAKR